MDPYSHLRPWDGIKPVRPFKNPHEVVVHGIRITRDGFYDPRCYFPWQYSMIRRVQRGLKNKQNSLFSHITQKGDCSDWY